MSGESLYFDDWGTGSDANIPARDSGTAWWQDTLNYVFKSAANAKWNAPQFGGNQQWIMTPDGRLVPAGVTGGQVINAGQGQQIPQWAMLAMLGLGAVMLYKLVK